jgi:ornithine cyclodeaminase
MAAAPPIWISEQDVVALMDVGDAIDALEKGLLAEARGLAQNMVKTHVAWGAGATLHAIGATFPADGFVGTKTWAHTEGGACPLLILFDAENGSLRGVVEAFALGQMRTGSASGVATRWLAAAGADEFAVIGTGKQAISQVAAVLAVRPVRRVRVFGRDEAKRARFAGRVREEFEVEAVAARSVAEAVEGASIITVVTRATEPVLTADLIAQGAHVNAVGAIVPSRAEVSRDVLARSSRVVADSVPSAQKLSRELMEFFGSPDAEGWGRVEPLSSVVAARAARRAEDDITLFKSLGMGISDLALGMELYRRARERGTGREFPQPQRSQPRLRVARGSKQ